MNSSLGFIAKILVLSTAISLAIKYGGPLLPISASSTTAWVAILLPSLLMAGLLGWRTRSS
ncbi:MAG: hypothetical protein SFW36_16170 [Leptolyngbyaceae cyanobacterium bins.59]|nr:hypothetical protein [Leptolyngbyaceae cyanobacterium bins.59]